MRLTKFHTHIKQQQNYGSASYHLQIVEQQTARQTFMYQTVAGIASVEYAPNFFGYAVFISFHCRSKLLDLYLIIKGLNNVMTMMSPWNIAICWPAMPVCTGNSTFSWLRKRRLRSLLQLQYGTSSIARWQRQSAQFNSKRSSHIDTRKGKENAAILHHMLTAGL